MLFFISYLARFKSYEGEEEGGGGGGTCKRNIPTFNWLDLFSHNRTTEAEAISRLFLIHGVYLYQIGEGRSLSL